MRDPGAAGFEALRRALPTALPDHNTRAQCELFSQMLIGSRYGGSVAACARSLGREGLPYMGTPEAYVAGGQIEFRGTEASYMIPFGQGEVPECVQSEPPQVAFTAVYTEGAWRIVARPPGWGEAAC